MNDHYAGPVILAEDIDDIRKQRLVTIDKDLVFKDIDLITHKHVDAREDMGVRSSNAVSSDSMEDVDGAVIARYVEFRNSELRVRLQQSMRDEYVLAANDNITLDDKHYYYALEVPEKFNDNTLRPLAEYIHRFLVWGALADWYGQFGSNQAAVYEDKVDDVEEKINSILRGPSIAKRPMQPFGPAEKIY